MIDDYLSELMFKKYNKLINNKSYGITIDSFISQIIRTDISDDDIYGFCSNMRNPIIHSVGVSKIGSFLNTELIENVTVDHLTPMTQSVYLLRNVILNYNITREQLYKLICVLNFGLIIPKTVNRDRRYTCKNFDDLYNWDKRLYKFDIKDIVIKYNNNDVIIPIYDIKKVWDKKFFEIMSDFIK